MRSQYSRRRRWNIDKWPKNKMQKERKLEEFRSFRTSKRRTKKVQRSNEREDVKIQNCFLDDKTQMINKATKFAIETEEKTLVEV